MDGYLDLASRVHAGTATAETVVELACLLAEHEQAGPAVEEVLVRRSEELSPSDVQRLGAALIEDYLAWQDAVTAVSHDLRATGLTGTLRLIAPEWDLGAPRVAYEDEPAGDRLHFGSGQAALTTVADDAQHAVMALTFSVWPLCHEHDLGLHPEQRGWVCRAGHTVAPIGRLDHVQTPSRQRVSRGSRPG